MSNKLLVSCVLCRNELTSNHLKIHYGSKQCQSGILFSKRVTKRVSTDMKCKFCVFVGKNNNSIAQHEIFCKSNPNKRQKIPSYGMKGKKGKGSNQYIKGTAKELTIEQRNRWSESTRKYFIEYWKNPDNIEKAKLRMRKAVKLHPESYTASNRGRTKQIIYEGIKFQGTWELLFYKWCQEHTVKCERYSGSGFPYVWNGERTYFSDFFLSEYDMYVEIKGYQTDRDTAKWQQFPKQLVILKKADILNIKNRVFKLPS